MSAFESNKKRWGRLGTVEYLRIEARPARKQLQGRWASSGASSPPTRHSVQIEVDWVSRPELGACKALQALQEAILRLRGERAREAFYKSLQQWAETQGRSLGPEDFASEYLRAQQEGRLRFELGEELAESVLASSRHTSDRALETLARRVLHAEADAMHPIAVMLAQAVLGFAPEASEETEAI